MEVFRRAFSTACAACLVAALVVPSRPARASGAVERMVQVLVDPFETSHVVVRWGAGSDGLLFSHDGGHTFVALCAGAIDAELTKLSRQSALYDSALTIDGRGQLLFADTSTVWAGDSAGCAWSKLSELEGKWISAIVPVPGNRSELLALAITTVGDGDDKEARSELMRRAESGAWSVVGPLKKSGAGQRAYAVNLITGQGALGTRLYASLSSSSGALNGPETTTIVVSEDAGTSWREQRAIPLEQAQLKLLAVDPLDLDRVLAVVPDHDLPDTLLVSDDQGNTFRKYAQISEFSGVAFDPSGRVFIADAGDGSAATSDLSGGLFAAASLGEPLTRLPNGEGESSPNLDCLTYDPPSAQLKVCKGHRFGLLDPSSGVFEEWTRLDLVSGLAACPGRDLKTTCAAQLNRGPSWCCAGHYPFTGFCGDYNVTVVDQRRVSCGLAGRAEDRANGNGPVEIDAGASAVGRSSDAQAGMSERPTADDARSPRGDDAGKDHAVGQVPTMVRASDGGCGGCTTIGVRPTGLVVHSLLVLAGLLAKRRRLRATHP